MNIALYREILYFEEEKASAFTVLALSALFRAMQLHIDFFYMNFSR
jgi:hypothetical protein